MVLQLTSLTTVEPRLGFKLFVHDFGFYPSTFLDLKIVGVKTHNSYNSIPVSFTTNPTHNSYNSIPVSFTTNPSLNALIQPYKSNAVLEL
jgi:hypothetical protein